MTRHEIEARRRAVAEQHGPWTAHVIYLGDGVYTFERDRPEFAAQAEAMAQHLRAYVQAVADVVRRPVADLRVLDLACLEGQYGLEFARHGAEVVLIEGREANLAKARFAGGVLGLDRVTYLCDDVRNLRAETHGRFDVVLCLGILYHLNFPDVVHFLERVSEVCRDAAIFRTQVAVRPDRTLTHDGREYRGWSYREHLPDATAEQKAKAAWASLDNDQSFWMSRPTLYNELARVGFTSVFAMQVPAIVTQFTDGDSLVAVKGCPVELRTLPDANAGPPARLPEQSPVGAYIDGLK